MRCIWLRTVGHFNFQPTYSYYDPSYCLGGLPSIMAPRMLFPAVLDGRLAVVCNLQSAIAGLNSPTR